MNREFTVLLKQPENPPPSRGKKIWDAINNLLKSQVFFFIFGSVSATAIIPWFSDQLVTEEQRRQIKYQEEARADAALIAPLLANLSMTDESKFIATKTLLTALEDVYYQKDEDSMEQATNDKEQSKNKKPKQERKVLAAVNQAIASMGSGVMPQPKSADSIEEESMKKTAKSIGSSTEVTGAAYQKLLDSLIYIQVDNSKSETDKKKYADRIRIELRKNMITTPEIEQIDSSKIPEKTQIRYFNNDDEEKAKNLALIVKNIIKREVFIVKPNLKAKKGVLEIWIGKE